MLPWERLRDKLYTLEGKPYAAYKVLEGEYRFDRFVLALDYIQGDPGGSPSPMRVRVDQAEIRLSPESWTTPGRRIALQDYLARRWQEAIKKVGRGARGPGRPFGFVIESGGQQVLERTACRLAEEFVEIRAGVALPSEGRKALPKEAHTLLLEDLPLITEMALMAGHPTQNPEVLQRHLDVAEDADALRTQLIARGLVAFIADGSILPREGGSDRPQLSRVVTFQAPPDLRVTLETPHRGPITGLGIPRGITLLTGPAFSGKSTLLRALAAGVYSHLPGDGREYCVTAADAVFVVREDGRRVEAVSLAPFITALPGGEDVRRYRTEHAPDLLSQVAGVMEALEMGASVLLFDEDATSPTLMARDPARVALMPDASDPVVPLKDVARALFAEHGVSTVLVSGSAGYADIADRVIGMDGFRLRALAPAAALPAAGPSGAPPAEGRVGGIGQRVVAPESVGQFRGRRARTDVHAGRTITIGREPVELKGVEQLVDPGQCRAVGDAIVFAAEQGYVDGSRSLREIVGLIDNELSQRGLDVLSPFPGHPGDYARPRRHEVAAALNRLRTLRIRS
ncbi:MAG TPA: ABC-ATPase domain-containing protein [bacterium]|jgi:predicted ABC-class ATPase